MGSIALELFQRNLPQIGGKQFFQLCLKTQLSFTTGGEQRFHRMLGLPAGLHGTGNRAALMEAVSRVSSNAQRLNRASKALRTVDRSRVGNGELYVRPGTRVSENLGGVPLP